MYIILNVVRYMDSLLFCETSVTKSQTESKGNRKWDF